jgi:quinol monooxygenase YgiN
MIIIAGRLYVRAEEREAYLAATADVASQARAIPGCLDFVQAADPLEPDRINIFEQWESDELLLQFRSGALSEPTVIADPVPVPEIRDAAVRKYRISAIEAP